MKINKETVNSEKIVWVAFLLILLAVYVWIMLSSPINMVAGKPSFGQYLLVFVTTGLLSFTISRLLTGGSAQQKKHYRTAILSVIGIHLTLMLLAVIIRRGTWHWPLFLLTILTSFVGSFVASNCAQGWWENNAPPSPTIKKEVFALHQAFAQAGGRHSTSKRLLDILFAAISLILSMPAWLLIIPIIWWEDPGPVLFVKNSVGRGGVNFKQLKFRSMILNAEEGTGPISGYENDDRVLFFGELLRKTALDELPQLINILLGDMSYVGPRPQRTVLVHGYLQPLPQYARRHCVRPGLAGLAQVVDTYDISPEEKLAWDLVYIDKANLWLDIKLAAAAFYLVFALRWLPNSHPELKIRQLLNIHKPTI